ncbi:tetratricopeptide repeat protein [Bradyrhizobium sp. Tv2a-2]|uniref:tetratricopeptide repeat-containing glycosyltransferase family protein n=1 Tax=Bradyrhizobium sp. Tv2a-2 TaxID=113395 RepID=UPI0004641AC6|nr:tetratricopeptide repeat protein [Bradyrhizobium sp. Tv2a-2]
MNRQQRRASAKQPGKSPTSPPRPAAADFFESALRLLRDGQLVEAETSCRQALAVEPDHADALHLMGLLCQVGRRYDLAIAWFAQAIRKNPAVADYFFNLATVLQHQDRVDDAIKSYDRGLVLKPDFAAGWYRLGELLLQQERRDEARLSFGQALKVDPRHLEAANSVALLDFHAGDYQFAIAGFDRSLAIKPNDPGALHLKGVCQLRLKRFDEALVNIGRALAQVPDHPEVICNYGLVLHKLGRDEEAIVHFDRALALKPDLVETLNHRGSALAELHRFDEALESFDRAVALRPEFADVHWNAALLRLLLGDFENGWPGREWGRKCRAVGFVERSFAQPLWLGEAPLAGKTILLHSDEGLGDTIQFSRYAPLVAAHGARVILEVDAALHPLLSGMDGVALCVPRGGSEVDDFDLHCPLSSLPLVCRTRLQSIPATPYLPALPEAVVGAWQARLGPRKAFRVGLAWSGNPAHGNDRNRSMRLRELAPLLDCDVTFVSLQKEPRAKDRACLQERGGIVDLTAHLANFVETAALISCLDLVITVDTSVAHLAGALFRPTWILLPYTPDYRWLLDRSDNPWYPTVRLFRQDATRDYARVVERVRTELQALITASRASAR